MSDHSDAVQAMEHERARLDQGCKDVRNHLGQLEGLIEDTQCPDPMFRRCIRNLLFAMASLLVELAGASVARRRVVADEIAKRQALQEQIVASRRERLIAWLIRVLLLLAGMGLVVLIQKIAAGAAPTAPLP